METKKCVRCEKIKSIEDFQIKRTENRRNSWCKACVYWYQSSRLKDRKRKALELLGKKCQICGYNKNMSALDFHHLDPSKKEYGWSQFKKYKWENVIKELKKCIILCKNCHAEIHSPSNTLLEVQNCHNNRLDISLKPKEIILTGKCPNCNKEVYGTKYCSVECVSEARRKIKRPDKKQLLKDVEELGYSGTGRKYGVSDNAIRKWLK